MLTKTILRITYLDTLIRRKATGTPKELAKKLGISERAWYKLRDQLVEDLQLPIAYCTYQKTYYYTQAGSFVVGFKPLTDSQKADLHGGGARPFVAQEINFEKNFSTALFVQCGHFTLPLPSTIAWQSLNVK